jgi:hypothetical protein
MSFLAFSVLHRELTCAIVALSVGAANEYVSIGLMTAHAAFAPSAPPMKNAQTGSVVHVTLRNSHVDIVHKTAYVANVLDSSRIVVNIEFG